MNSDQFSEVFLRYQVDRLGRQNVHTFSRNKNSVHSIYARDEVISEWSFERITVTYISKTISILCL